MESAIVRRSDKTGVFIDVWDQSAGDGGRKIKDAFPYFGRKARQNNCAFFPCSHLDGDSAQILRRDLGSRWQHQLYQERIVLRLDV